MPRKHILVDITSHGFGHMAQTIEVLDALNQQHKGLFFTLRSHLPKASVYQRLAATLIKPAQVDLVQGGFDLGLHMFDAIQVDVERSMQAYRQLHHQWKDEVRTQSEQMRQLKPDLVLANISYLSLAAAKQAGFPVVAFCSLDWASIFQTYCEHLADAEAIYADMLEAYNAADLFLQLQPHLPMQDFQNCVSVPAIARPGKKQRDKLRRHLGLAAETPIGIISMGGIPTKIDWAHWPQRESMHWLSDANTCQRGDIHAIRNIPMDFSDILASSDLVITKTGYGMIVEAALAQVPVLYIERPEWPEEPHLQAWSRAHNRSLTFRREQLNNSTILQEKIDTVLNMPKPERCVETGEKQAADYIGQFL